MKPLTLFAIGSDANIPPPSLFITIITNLMSYLFIVINAERSCRNDKSPVIRIVEVFNDATPSAVEVIPSIPLAPLLK
ncbi:MAG: hypothetical protein M5T52_08490 [Ignavibacteriaceae bacterium]|nr:hypothetical protein [Ignavibacteriaceae bacterium]